MQWACPWGVDWLSACLAVASMLPAAHGVSKPSSHPSCVSLSLSSCVSFLSAPARPPVHLPAQVRGPRGDWIQREDADAASTAGRGGSAQGEAGAGPSPLGGPDGDGGDEGGAAALGSSGGSGAAAAGEGSWGGGGGAGGGEALSCGNRPPLQPGSGGGRVGSGTGGAAAAPLCMPSGGGRSGPAAAPASAGSHALPSQPAPGTSGFARLRALPLRQAASAAAAAAVAALAAARRSFGGGGGSGGDGRGGGGPGPAAQAARESGDGGSSTDPGSEGRRGCGGPVCYALACSFEHGIRRTVQGTVGTLSSG
jgi:hypothetical protein